MHAEQFSKFSGKELTTRGMRVITGGDDSVILIGEPKPKKVFPSTSSATNIKPGAELEEKDLILFELP